MEYSINLNRPFDSRILTAVCDSRGDIFIYDEDGVEISGEKLTDEEISRFDEMRGLGGDYMRENAAKERYYRRKYGD